MTTVSFDKFFVQGILAGLTVSETMTFTDFDTACKWAAGVTENLYCDYVVQNMVDASTGQKANF